MGKQDVTVSQELDIESGSILPEKEEKSILSKLSEYKDWLPLVIVLFVLLISLIITLSLVKYNSEQSDITTKRTLFHHFPYGKHDKCCSTEEDKANFLKDCNKIFSDYDIRCTNTKPGSIIVEYETFLKNTDEVMKNVFSKVDKIGEHCPTDDHESVIYATRQKKRIIAFAHIVG